MSTKTKDTETYNGWRNRATWNVALWIQNDESLYLTALEWVRSRKAAGRTASYSRFIEAAWLKGECTPDRFAYDGRGLDRAALTEMLQELDD